MDLTSPKGNHQEPLTLKPVESKLNCVHYWNVPAPPEEPLAVCLNCGDERMMQNYIEINVWKRGGTKAGANPMFGKGRNHQMHKRNVDGALA